MLTGRVLITGGAGFLGRGILRRACRENWPVKFTVYSRDEYKQDLARRQYGDIAEFVLGDILDVERLSLAARGHDTIIHAAAIKFIPEGEFNVNECVRVNVDGTRSVLRAARIARINHVVAISTDKAVLPINAYGMTKAIMERLVGEAARLDGEDRHYATCRYGNVVGSTGSIVPVFKSMIEKSNCVWVTDPDMTRFWISIDDAVDLIVRSMAEDVVNGATVIPQPRAMRIIDVARSIIDMWGETDTDIAITGKRPGEKMHEDLLSEPERQRTLPIDNNYFALLQPGASVVSDIAPRLTSSEPYAWMQKGEMAQLILDSELV